MTRAGPLRWRSGRGWLMLSGDGCEDAQQRGGSTDIEGEGGDIQAAALGWADLGRPVAVLPTAGTSIPQAEALIETYTDLGAPSGYVVPIFDVVGAQLAENCQLLQDAGLVHIHDGPDMITLVRAFRASPAMEALIEAFERGAMILGAGAGAAALGAWVADTGPEPAGSVRAEPGWRWLDNVVIAPHFQGTEEAHRLRHLLQLKPDCLGLGIPDRTALGLGPAGEVENLGIGQVTVVVSGLQIEV